MKIIRYFIVVSILCTLQATSLAKGKQETIDVNTTLIGISLPSQRSVRWVRDRNAFYRYAKEHNIDIIIQFSDDDTSLQAYQIKKLVNNGIETLIVSTEGSRKVIDALEYAKSKGVFIMAYNNLIVDTYAVDFYIAFNHSTFGVVDSLQMIQVEELIKVVNGDIEFTWLLDSSVLAKTALVLAYEFIDNPPRMRNYVQVNNGVRHVLTLWVEPIQITQENYMPLVIESKIVKESALSQ